MSLNGTSTTRKFQLLTLSPSPSGDDAVGTVSDRSTRETDRLDHVIVRQRARQAYYSDVIVSISVVRIALVYNYRNTCESLSVRIGARKSL